MLPPVPPSGTRRGINFGDGWTHGIKLIETHESTSDFKLLPACLDGERAGPPEDSGGIWGYEEKIEILRNPDPNNEWHQEVVEWMGRFDTEAFDVAATNRQIQGIRRKRQTGGRGPKAAQRRGTKRRRRKR